MATINAALRSIAKISLICVWTETVLYGVNCVMYGLCMFILLRGGKTATLSRLLVVMSTILFLLCTVHVGASLQQLLEAFVYASINVPSYSSTYWLANTRMSFLKHCLYNALVLAQYSILIWRLYVIYLCNWKVVIIPAIMALALTSTLYSISVLSERASVHGSLVSTLIRSAWVLDMILNVSVTVAIAARLWWMGRKVASPTTRTNRYATSVYVIVESGAIVLAINIAILGLYTTNNPTAFSILDVASQLAALAPFLIVVQVALTGRYRSPRIRDNSSDDLSSAALTTLDDMVFNAGGSEEQDLEQVVPRGKS